MLSYFSIMTILIPTINYTIFTMQAACKQTTGNYVLLKYLYSDDSPCESTVGLPLFARHYSPFKYLSSFQSRAAKAARSIPRTNSSIPESLQANTRLAL